MMLRGALYARGKQRSASGEEPNSSNSCNSDLQVELPASVRRRQHNNAYIDSLSSDVQTRVLDLKAIVAKGAPKRLVRLKLQNTFHRCLARREPSWDLDRSQIDPQNVSFCLRQFLSERGPNLGSVQIPNEPFKSLSQVFPRCKSKREHLQNQLPLNRPLLVPDAYWSPYPPSCHPRKCPRSYLFKSREKAPNRHGL